MPPVTRGGDCCIITEGKRGSNEAVVESGQRHSLGIAQRSRSFGIRGLALRKQLWIWPILAAIILGICGWLVSRSVETAMRERRESELATILSADIAALKVWLVEQARDAELIAKDDQLLPAVQKLVAAGQPADNAGRALLQSPAKKPFASS